MRRMLIKGVTRHGIERYLRASHVGVRRRWLAKFRPEIEALVGALCDTGRALRIFEQRAESTQRSLRVLEFLYLAYHGLATSSHLLISGLLVPAGNQMRFFAEALAMALLCSEPAERVLEDYDANPKRYSIQAAPDRLTRKKTIERLSLDPSASQLSRVAKFYSKFSHASVVAEAAIAVGSAGPALDLAVEFREKLIPVYRNELSRRLSAAQALHEAATELARRLSMPNPRLEPSSPRRTCRTIIG